MSKQTELFRVQNSDWTIIETAKDVFTLASSGGERIGGLSAKRLVSALAVISEAQRYIRASKR